MEVDQDPYQGTLMNMKFHPSNMKSEDDLKKLGSMIKTYLTHGGKHIQFNVVDRAEMEDAKIHPGGASRAGGPGGGLQRLLHPPARIPSRTKSLSAPPRTCNEMRKGARPASAQKKKER